MPRVSDHDVPHIATKELLDIGVVASVRARQIHIDLVVNRHPVRFTTVRSASGPRRHMVEYPTIKPRHA